jgi:hypothetical protein
VLELSPEAQVAQGLNWRTLVQLAGNILVIGVIINFNLEDKPRNPEPYAGEERFEKKVRVRVQGKMWM